MLFLFDATCGRPLSCQHQRAVEDWDTFRAISRVLHDLQAKLVFDILSALSNRLELDLLGIVRRIIQKSLQVDQIGDLPEMILFPFESTASTVEVEANSNHQQRLGGQHIMNQESQEIRFLKEWRGQK